MLILLSSCSESNKSEILIIPVDVNQDESIPLSVISENIQKIELETTDECLIGEGLVRVLASDEYIIYLNNRRGGSYIFLFDINGKFLRQISKRGQGPGEYGRLLDVTADFINNRIYMSTDSYKLICYDFEGNFISEVMPFDGQFLNFINGKLTTLTTKIASDGVGNYQIVNILYEINDKLQIIDSITLSSNNSNEDLSIIFANNNYMTYTDGDMYLYNPPSNADKKTFINQDTLYQLKDKKIIPHLRLKYSDEKSNPGKSTMYIYKTSRYIFEQRAGKNAGGWFCYDMKTKKGTNMKKSYIDDIYTGKNVEFHLLETDVNKFYYTYTNVDDSEKDEPNPTLYIGTLKK